MRRICFVTGTRAEFGLMRTALHAIAAHPALRLQVIITGMHLDPRHGHTARAVAAEFPPDAVIPWPAASGATPTRNAVNTGRAIATLAQTFQRLRSDIVLLVGDRVEAFAAASAAHLAHRAVAHVHGGDRALGQIDDSLRHAITKLAHLHFPATTESARRIAALGEDRWRIHRVGSPGLDGIRAQAAPWKDLASRFPGLPRRQFALLVIHPTGPDEDREYRHASTLLRAAQAAGFERSVIVYPNNDPGCRGILRCWQQHATDPDLFLCPDLPRPVFLGLLRDAAVLAGNSSAGIIEAASFSLPVLDIGPRQAGRQRSANVRHCDGDYRTLLQHLRRFARSTRRPSCANVYAGQGAGRRIAHRLAAAPLDARLFQKLIRY